MTSKEIIDGIKKIDNKDSLCDIAHYAMACACNMSDTDYISSERIFECLGKPFLLSKMTFKAKDIKQRGGNQ
ncbi:MAG: hypothetical protein J6K31_08515 [Parabacteroides sp.]|nr:hypothetical protein [Parabacteroides sp.]